MKKRVAAAVATVGLMVGVAAVPAAAEHEDVGCPRGFESFSPVPGDERADRNGDDLICVKFIRGSGGNSVVPGVVIIDNNAQ